MLRNISILEIFDSSEIFTNHVGISKQDSH